MKIGHTITLVLLLGLGLLLVPSCTAGPIQEKTSTEQVAATPQAIHEASRLPVQVTLVGTMVEGALELHATITVSGRIPDQARLELVLPLEATITTGKQMETLVGLTPGDTLERSWDVDYLSGTVELHLHAAGAASGVTARAFYPPDQVGSVPTVSRTPLEGIRVHGVPIRSSIPIRPAEPPTPADESAE